MSNEREQSLFWGASRWLTPILWFAVIAAICETLTVGAMFAAANLAPEQSPDRYYLYFLIALTMYMLAVRTFKKHLHNLFEGFIAETRLKIMERVGAMPLLAFERLGMDAVYTALTLDMKALSELSYTIAATAYAGFLVVGIVAYLLILSADVFALTICIGGAAGVGYGYYHAHMRESIQQAREHESAIFDAIQQLLSGFKELRLNHQKNDAFFYECITPHLAELRHIRLRANRWLTWSYVLTYGVWKLLIIAPVLLLPIVGAFTQNGLLTFLGLLLFIPTSYLVEEIPKIMLAKLTMQRLYRLYRDLEASPPEAASAEPLALSQPFERIVYRQFTFHYEDIEGRSFFLGPLTITIQPGEIVFITGANGSGKTTLLKLLTGLYAPDAGQTLLNGQIIDLRQYRLLFAAIFSDVHVFDRFYDGEPVDMDQAALLLQELRLDLSVQLINGAWSTLKLSTGQKKRLALICALLRDRPIYVFDEWAADQDPQFRRYFYQTILPILKARGKTVIAVTHDDQYFACADRILKMEYGQLLT